MADYYVRPKTASYGAEDGLSHTTAWSGFDAIVWASLGAGDTLYVCGEHKENRLSIQAGGAVGNPLTIRGDYSGDEVLFTSTRQVGTWVDTAVNNEWKYTEVADSDNEWLSTTPMAMIDDNGIPIPHAPEADIGSLLAGYWAYDSTLDVVYYRAPDSNEPTGTYHLGGGSNPLYMANSASDWSNIDIIGFTFELFQTAFSFQKTTAPTPTNINISDCVFNNVSVAIQPDAGNNYVIENCTFNYGHSTLISFGNTGQVLNMIVRDCLFYRSLWVDTDSNGEGHIIDVLEFQDSQGLIVENCEFRENHWQGGSTLTGVDSGGGAGDEGKYGAHMISVDGSHNNTIRNNLFIDNYIGAIQGGPNAASPSWRVAPTGLYIHNNLFINNGNTEWITGTSVDANAAIQNIIAWSNNGGVIASYDADVHIYNNLFHHSNAVIPSGINAAGHGANVRVSFDHESFENINIYNNIFSENENALDISIPFADGGFSGIHIRNNSHYRTSAVDYLFLYDGAYNDYPVTQVLSVWISDVSEVGSVHGSNPSLDNNYKPQGDSPCIGAGIQPLSLIDYNGDTRKSNAGFDIGAVWFDGPSDTTVERLLASGGTK